MFERGVKLLTCPHCRCVGFLILHGFLYGYDLKSDDPFFVRGKRFFCSNRNNKRGCGKTFSLLKAQLLRCCSISAEAFWGFINNIHNGMPKVRALNLPTARYSTSSIYRLWQKFKHSLPHIRTLLTTFPSPPCSQSQPYSNTPEDQTIEDIKVVFPSHDCPISAFQEIFQANFFG